MLLQCLLRSRFFTCSLCNLSFSHHASFSFPYYTSLSLFSFWNLGSTHCTHCLSETLTFKYGQMRGIWRESTSGPCNKIFRLIFWSCPWPIFCFHVVRDTLSKLMFRHCDGKTNAKCIAMARQTFCLGDWPPSGKRTNMSSLHMCRFDIEIYFHLLNQRCWWLPYKSCKVGKSIGGEELEHLIPVKLCKNYQERLCKNSGVNTQCKIQL